MTLPTPRTDDPRPAGEEPVRLSGYTAIAVGLGLQALILFSAGAPPLAVLGAVAAMALSVIPGLEFARRHVTPWPLSPTQVRQGIEHAVDPETNIRPYISYDRRVNREPVFFYRDDDEEEGDLPPGPGDRAE